MTYRQMQYVGLVFGLLMLVPSPQSVQAAARTRRVRCHRIFVSSAEAPLTRRARPKFSAAEIIDVQLQALVSRNLAGHHSLEFKVYTPKGNLYQSMTLQFDADVSASEDASRQSRRFLELNTVLPVAGTSIVTSSMYGAWKVEAFLDGDDRRCSLPKKFVIQP